MCIRGSRVQQLRGHSCDIVLGRVVQHSKQDLLFDYFFMNLFGCQLLLQSKVGIVCPKNVATFCEKGAFCYVFLKEKNTWPFLFINTNAGFFLLSLMRINALFSFFDVLVSRFWRPQPGKKLGRYLFLSHVAFTVLIRST